MSLLSWIKKSSFGIAIGVLTITPAFADTAEWTLMVFMNAKNNIEGDALANFREIASVGSSSKVNVVVELGRPKSHYTSEAGGWSGVLKFHVEKGQDPSVVRRRQYLRQPATFGPRFSGSSGRFHRLVDAELSGKEVHACHLEPWSRMAFSNGRRRGGKDDSRFTSAFRR